MTKAAIGFRAHSGWAMLVAVAGSVKSPIVIKRRRIELIEPGIPKQPYHAAVELPFAEAGKLIKRCEDVAARLAERALGTCAAELREGGYEPTCCGVLLGSGRPVGDLAAVLKSHPMLHTAEGVLIRDALKRGAEKCGLEIVGIKEKELYDFAAKRLRVAADEVRKRVTEAGRGIGPPWGQDQKDAALVGWLALGDDR